MRIDYLLLLIAGVLTRSSCEPCSPTWQENQAGHQPSDLTSNSSALLYLADTLKDEADFESHLDTILTERVVNTIEHDNARDYIANTLTTLGWDVQFDSFVQDTPIGEMPFANIFATLNPDSPRRFLLACHYDTYRKVGTGFVGAVDAAVPCAMLLNLATTMKPILEDLVAQDPELTPALVFFDGEEAMEYWSSLDSVYGSTHISSLWNNTSFWVADNDTFCQTSSATDLERLDVLMLLDLIGTPAPDFQEFIFDGSETNSYYDMMEEIESALDQVLPANTTSMFNGKAGGGGISDDHSPFLKLDYTSIFHVITRPFPSVWHKVDDNKDALDMAYIERINELLRIFVAQYLKY